MFAKVFGQIFDSSIAEDYNCRRMFMDLLVLADSTGAVDMTPEAISRRTNVPQPEVEKYIAELCQPDARSRSDLHEGKRLIPLDDRREWGWMIVNYQHYRAIKDEEARRTYFRNAQREYRKGKKKVVKDKGLTELNTNGQPLTPSSTSSSKSVSEEEIKEYCISIGLPRSDGEAMFLHWSEKKWPKNWKLTIKKWKSFGYMPSQKQRKNGAHPDNPKPLDKSKIEVPERFKAWVSERYPAQRESAMKWQTWADVPSSGLRDEWWREEKSKLPIGDML
jgi:hypothetical protein